MPARPSTPFLYSPIKRVAEEKAKAQETTHVVDRGGASQTVEKTSDGLEEASSGDGDIQSVQERYKEHEPGADYRRRDDS
ncbi:hypothetical protein GH714_007363 [Hevea brasiliensis]|uniref:Uncharacterized protein n=1 Tax=Hevea brasiliensis TaxID=3981 RepID=A0A6A6KC65_HEVBR|nr:hypothetical protein GH714_007363 [Hevea brasiliensis]